MITPEAIFEKSPQFSDREWAEYIAVASYRNLNSYYENRKTTLDLLHNPVPEVIINNNRLLKIENGVIHFRFEKSP